MALSDLSHDSLLPGFLYSLRSFAAASARFPSSPSPYQAPAAAPAAGLVGAGGVGGSRPFSVHGPNEKIIMYSAAFCATCSIGGIDSCGLTHMAITPLDLVKCNMQVRMCLLCFVRNW
ncbi:hypothetical protein VPH35_054851 [Triticum aestivum]